MFHLAISLTIAAAGCSHTQIGSEVQRFGKGPVVHLVAEELVEHSDWSGYWCPDLFPPTQHRTFPGHDRGLLVAVGAQDWGTTIGIRGISSHSAGVGYYAFFAEDTPAASLNFISEGQGYRFQKHTLARDEEGNAIAFNAARFGPDTPNDWQLSRGAHLVEVEINGGLEGSGHFIATDVQVLDGTAEFPLGIEDSLTSARALFDVWSEEMEPVTKEMMRSHREELPERFKGRRYVGGSVGVWPTWYDESGELEVVIVECPMETTEGPEREVEPTPCAYDPVHGFAPCIEEPPGPKPTVREARQYGYGQAVRYRFDRQGKLMLETRYIPRSFPSN